MEKNVIEYEDGIQIANCISFLTNKSDLQLLNMPKDIEVGKFIDFLKLRPEIEEINLHLNDQMKFSEFASVLNCLDFNDNFCVLSIICMPYNMFLDDWKFLESSFSIKSLKKLSISNLLKAHQGDHIKVGYGLSTNNSLESLSLQNCGLTGISCQIISDSLKLNTSLLVLDLFQNNIENEGALSISNMLVINKNLEELYLGCNEINNVGAIAIFQALEINNSLKTLSLSTNSFEGYCAESIEKMLNKNKSLTSLNLYDNFLYDSGITLIAHGLKNNQTLYSLCIGDCRYSVEGLKEIIEALKINKSLRILNFYRMEFEDEGGIIIGNALSQNWFMIENIDLGHTAMKDFGALKIAEGLLKNKRLKVLDLGLNRLTKESGIAIANALLQNNSLEKISINLSSLEKDDITKIVEILNKRKIPIQFDI